MSGDVASAGHRDLARADRRRSAQPALRGAELVAVSQRFHHGIFRGTLSFVALSTFTALAFLPLRSSAIDGRPPAITVAAALAVLLLTAPAIRYVRHLYRLLLRRPRLQLAGVAVAAILLSVVSPLRNELWWSSCAILMALATLVPLRRALAYCLVALLANLAAHVATGTIHETSTVGILGLWIGMPFWVAMAAVIPDRMALHILRLNATRDDGRPAPHPVGACDTARPQPRPDPRADPPHGGHDEVPAPALAPAPAGGERTARLTARQLEVVALLAEGLRYRDIAACLSISPGQVQRHVAHAIRRLGVQTASELVAVAVAEGVLASDDPDQVTEY